MHGSRVIAAVVIGILVIIGVGVALVGGTGNPATISPASVVADVTPPGWVPVDFGNAQVSVPAHWNVYYDPACPGQPPGTLFVINVPCSASPSPVTDFPLVTIDPCAGCGPADGFHKARVNGITVWSAVLLGTLTVRVPTFGIEISATGPHENPSATALDAQRVINTLTRSPAAVAFATGPAPPVPSSWTLVTAGALQFAVPNAWPTTATDVQGPGCGRGIVLNAPNRVLLDRDTVTGGFHCRPVRWSYRPATPENGIVVDLHLDSRANWPPGPHTVGPCTSRNGLTLCPYRRPLTNGDYNAETDILFEQITVQSTGRRYMVEIGLAGDGMVARTILYSLRAA